MEICNKYALELVRDIIPTSSCEIETKLVNLIIWAYEQGYAERAEEEREWRRDND